MLCLTRSSTSDRFASLNRFKSPTKYEPPTAFRQWPDYTLNFSMSGFNFFL